MSALLQQEATSSLPSWISDPMLVVLAMVIVGRLVFVGERQLERHQTSLLFWWLCTALLRESWVQNLLLDRTPLTLSDIRLLTHATAMFAAGVIVLVVRSFVSVRRLRARTVVWVYSSIAALVAALAWIGAPARAAGVAVEELHDWRTAAYMIVYSLQMPIAIVVAVVSCIHIFFRGEQRARTLVWASVILLAGMVSAFDHLTRMVNGIMLAFDQQNGFTEWRSESNDVLFLPAVTALALSISLPVVAGIRARLRSDESSVAVTRLTPMWRDLSAALPTISLQAATTTLPSSTEREHRMRIECEDALYELLGYMTADERAEGLDPVSRCAAVTHALERRRSGASADRAVPAPSWLADEDDLLRIADAWSKRPVATGLV